MNEYDFALHYRVNPDVNPESYIDPLFEAKCDDCALHFGKSGYVELDFIREASTVSEAIKSAIQNVKLAIPDAKLCYISLDIVGVSEIAQIMDCSRQYVQQIVNNNYTFPIPLHSQNKSIWHLVYVLKWLKENGKSVQNIDVWLETAKFVRAFNNAHNHQDIGNTYDAEIEELICI